jgi:xylulokinase
MNTIPFPGPGTMPITAPRPNASPTLTLGYDLGSSFIKASILDVESGRVLMADACPAQEMAILSVRPGWAEQDPEQWWDYVTVLTQRLLKRSGVAPEQIRAIGIAYQMHGLVCVDESQRVLRPAILWCDSRAVGQGQRAFDTLGHEECLARMLNSPGNFTASKLRWVRENEPELYGRIHRVLLPGDFLAMKLTGEACTTLSGLSEGIFWDFLAEEVAHDLLKHYELDESQLPKRVPTFGDQGTLSRAAAQALGLVPGIPVTYRAGDQPNSAFSLGVLEPGEVAATAGTSGVVYGILDRRQTDPLSRVNIFAHVNHAPLRPRLGALLCINGCGILYAWLKKQMAGGLDYDSMNARAARVPQGAEGLRCYPFGNGAERMLGNQSAGGCLAGLDFNRHTLDHVLRAGLEGIAFSFHHGMSIMAGMGISLGTLRAGKANLFLSPVFRQMLADLSGATIQLVDTDGALGAARGAACGAGLIPSLQDAVRSIPVLTEIHPDSRATARAAETYEQWSHGLKPYLASHQGEPS